MDIERKTVAELKQMLREMGEPVSGNKSDLVARINALSVGVNEKFSTKSDDGDLWGRFLNRLRVNGGQEEFRNLVSLVILSGVLFFTFIFAAGGTWGTMMEIDVSLSELSAGPISVSFGDLCDYEDEVDSGDDDGGSMCGLYYASIVTRLLIWGGWVAGVVALVLGFKSHFTNEKNDVVDLLIRVGGGTMLLGTIIWGIGTLIVMSEMSWGLAFYLMLVITPLSIVASEIRTGNLKFNFGEEW